MPGLHAGKQRKQSKKMEIDTINKADTYQEVQKGKTIVSQNGH